MDQKPLHLNTVSSCQAAMPGSGRPEGIKTQSSERG